LPEVLPGILSKKEVEIKIINWQNKAVFVFWYFCSYLRLRGDFDELEKKKLLVEKRF
jgi:hypothetical protein